MIHVHARLHRLAAVGLQHALGHALGHLGGGIADIDLARGDVEGPPVQDGGFGQAGDGVLGGGVGRAVRARPVGADRAIVDDAPAARLLRLHHPDRLLGAEKGAGEIDADNGLPLFKAQLLDRNGGGAHAGIVEQHVQAAELVLDLGEDGFHGRRVADIGGRDQVIALQAFGGLLQRVLLAAHQRQLPALRRQRTRRCPPHAAARAGDHCDFVHIASHP